MFGVEERLDGHSLMKSGKLGVNLDGKKVEKQQLAKALLDDLKNIFVCYILHGIVDVDMFGGLFDKGDSTEDLLSSKQDESGKKTTRKRWLFDNSAYRTAMLTYCWFRLLL